MRIAVKNARRARGSYGRGARSVRAQQATNRREARPRQAVVAPMPTRRGVEGTVCGFSGQDQQANQPPNTQQQEADDHTVHQAKTRLLRVVRWNHSRFDVIAALPVHCVNDRTHAGLAAIRGPPIPPFRQDARTAPVACGVQGVDSKVRKEAPEYAPRYPFRVESGNGH